MPKATRLNREHYGLQAPTHSSNDNLSCRRECPERSLQITLCQEKKTPQGKNQFQQVPLAKDLDQDQNIIAQLPEASTPMASALPTPNWLTSMLCLDDTQGQLSCELFPDIPQHALSP